ncbi:hypothetical protein ACFXPA_24455 [Amycolatopsis sp. NPDC059090]|uniref:hypothetical protein n=1 Tax=unclassified Amycolatopsis TaxID=2618356 RepID=UPI00366F5536
MRRGARIYAYSFACANIDISTSAKAVAVERWYRQRATIENIFRDSKHDAALSHPPSGYAEVKPVWMHGALLAANLAAGLHELAATQCDDGDGNEKATAGQGIRGGKAMTAALPHLLIRIPCPPGQPRRPTLPHASTRSRPDLRDPCQSTKLPRIAPWPPGLHGLDQEASDTANPGRPPG